MAGGNVYEIEFFGFDLDDVSHMSGNDGVVANVTGVIDADVVRGNIIFFFVVGLKINYMVTNLDFCLAPGLDFFQLAIGRFQKSVSVYFSVKGHISNDADIWSFG